MNNRKENAKDAGGAIIMVILPIAILIGAVWAYGTWGMEGILYLSAIIAAAIQIALVLAIFNMRKHIEKQTEIQQEILNRLNNK